MRTITLTAENEQDYELVLKLAQRLGLEYREETLAAPATEATIRRSLPDLSQLTPAEIQDILSRGGSGTSIPDPVAWQRAERQDRPLPSRS